MPLGRKHLRRSRDAPTGGMAMQRTKQLSIVYRTRKLMFSVVHPGRGRGIRFVV